MQPVESYDESPAPAPAFGTKRQEGFRPVADRESYVDVPGLLVRFERQSPVLHIVESLLYAGSQPPDSIQPLFSALANSHRKYWHERVVSIWALGRMQLSLQERDAAAGMLLDLVKTHQGNGWGQSIGRGSRLAFWIAVPSSLLLTLIAGDDSPFFDTFFSITLPLFGIAALFTIPAALIVGKSGAEHDGILRAAAAETLGRLGSLESIGDLADALFDRNVKVQESAALALQMILPTLSSEHYGKLDSKTLHALGHSLSSGDTLLAFAVLEALEKVGSSVAIPYVARMATSGQTALLRETAQRVQGVLEERKRSRRYAEELGRPASGTTTPPDELLRPDIAPNDDTPFS